MAVNEGCCTLTFRRGDSSCVCVCALVSPFALPSTYNNIRYISVCNVIYRDLLGSRKPHVRIPRVSSTSCRAVGGISERLNSFVTYQTVSDASTTCTTITTLILYYTKVNIQP